MRGRRVRNDLRLAEKDDHILVAGCVRVEMQGDPGVLLQVGNLMRIRSAEDEKGITFPDEPDRPGLRGQVGADGGEPDDIFTLEVPFYLVSEISAEIDHFELQIRGIQEALSVSPLSVKRYCELK